MRDVGTHPLLSFAMNFLVCYIKYFIQCSLRSVQFSHSVMSDSLRPHRLQYARLLCPSPIPRACSNSCPLSQWCHPTISSSVVPFSSCLNPSQHQSLFQWVSSSHEVANYTNLKYLQCIIKVENFWEKKVLYYWIELSHFLQLYININCISSKGFKIYI